MPKSQLSRRSILRATSGALSVTPVVGTTSGDTLGKRGRCPEATVDPEMEHCAGANVEACADDHPETEAIQAAVSQTLENRYPDVGTLIDEGFIPYFDLAKSGEEGGYSHWLNPDFIGDETVLDPDRPESVLVDNKWWRPIGVMFIATENGKPVDDPPAVYGESPDACSPWHYHVGLPGRFAWWYYQKVYDDDRKAGLRLPCRTPCMLHVWTFPNPKGVYAHGPPPRGNRGGPPAEDPGFETLAVPGQDELSWDTLPDDLVNRYRPGTSLRELLFG